MFDVKDVSGEKGLDNGDSKAKSLTSAASEGDLAI